MRYILIVFFSLLCYTDATFKDLIHKIKRRRLTSGINVGTYLNDQLGTSYADEDVKIELNGDYCPTDYLPAMVSDQECFELYNLESGTKNFIYLNVDFIYPGDKPSWLQTYIGTLGDNPLHGGYSGTVYNTFRLGCYIWNTNPYGANTKQYIYNPGGYPGDHHRQSTCGDEQSQCICKKNSYQTSGCTDTLRPAHCKAAAAIVGKLNDQQKLDIELSTTINGCYDDGDKYVYRYIKEDGDHVFYSDKVNCNDNTCVCLPDTLPPTNQNNENNQNTQINALTISNVVPTFTAVTFSVTPTANNIGAENGFPDVAVVCSLCSDDICAVDEGEKIVSMTRNNLIQADFTFALVYLSTSNEINCRTVSYNIASSQVGSDYVGSAASESNIDSVPMVFGCTNSAATNYAAENNVDDGSCFRNCIGAWSDCINSVQTYTFSVTKIGSGTECPYQNNQQESCVSEISTDSVDTMSLSYNNIKENIDLNNKNHKKNGKSIFREMVENNFDMRSVKYFSNIRAEKQETVDYLKSHINSIRSDENLDAERDVKAKALKLLIPKKVRIKKSYTFENVPDGTEEEKKNYKINNIKQREALTYNTVEELVEVIKLEGDIVVNGRRRLLQDDDTEVVVNTDEDCDDAETDCTEECDGFIEDGVCVAYTACETNEYIIVPGTDTEDNVCASECPNGVTSSNEEAYNDNFPDIPRLCDLCQENYRVDGDDFTCSKCPKGFTTPVAPRTAETSCFIDPNVCETNEYVRNNKCIVCPPGTVNLRGDDPNGEDTSCDDTYICKPNYHVVYHSQHDVYFCKRCETGWTHGGDNPLNEFETSCCEYGEYESSPEGYDLAPNSFTKIQIPKVCSDCGTNNADIHQHYASLKCCTNTIDTFCQKMKLDLDIHCLNENC